MAKIQQLSAHEAQKIAAGQVVERPADIIKELIENSIDAGATAITLFVENAGISLIRVVDNGCGMDADDAQRCFDKHATSKLRSMSELQTITTFGFRGEAMPSIAAVCKVTLITRTRELLEGVRVCVQENKITSVDTVSAPVGTDISASDLFYTIPVRKKFLKKPETEWRHIVQLMQACALAHLSIHFKVISDGNEVYNWPAVDSCMSRCAQIWDSSISRHMVSVDARKDTGSLHVVGAISDHQQFRFDRSGIFIFVNSRWVKNFKLTNALINGYMNVAPAGRYPMACISLTIDPQLVDINIHPRKEEIKFEHPVVVEQFLKTVVKERLEQSISEYTKRPVTLAVSPQVSFEPVTSRSPVTVSTHTPFIDFAPFEELSARTALASPAMHMAMAPEPYDFSNTAQQIEVPADFQIASGPDRAYKLIGQYHNTYLLLEQEDGLFLVDQHAAHERILYEKFGTKFDDMAVVSLLFAQRITLNPTDYQILLPYLSLLNQVGIGIEEFGHNQLKVHALPVYIKDINMSEFIMQVVGWIHELQTVEKSELSWHLMEKLRAQMACKAAVKAGDVLTSAQMVQLLDDLEKAPNRLTCPHGRPTGWFLSLHEIEKKFKRKT